jgi:iron-sulfur cluster assembly protein
MLKITPSAEAEIKRLQLNSPKPEKIIYLTLKSGGCCDLTYTFEFKQTVDMVVWEGEGIKIAIAPEAQPYLENLKIDYAEDLMGGGFRFENPQATSTCSCSQSFCVKEMVKGPEG